MTSVEDILKCVLVLVREKGVDGRRNAAWAMGARPNSDVVNARGANCRASDIIMRASQSVRCGHSSE
jgi:hypothetical protein